MPISNPDHQRISNAIHAAEAGTSGEIVCVLARSSGDYNHIPLVWASLASLLVPWALMALTQWTLIHILLSQLIVFAGLWMVFSIPVLAMALVPRRLARGQAHRAALEQFMVRGVSKTRDRTGILIFVSLAERYVRIVADDGIAVKITQQQWQGIVDTLVNHLRQDQIADGFVAAVASCGEVLAAHFPPESTHKNQLPDRLYVI